MQKKTIYIFLLILSAVIIGIIWVNCHAGQRMEAVETGVNSLYTSVDKTQGDQTVKPVIDSIQQAIAEEKYTDVKPAFDVVFGAFLKAWGKDKLTRETVNAYKPLFKSQFKAYRHLRLNQLVAFILDEFIWLFALGLCLFSDVLRDIVGDASKIPPGKMPSYSLARTQLVVWITIIGSVYTYAILWDRRDLGIINQTALILMGISSGTFATAAIMDTLEIQQGVPRIQDHPSSGNFLLDILSDGAGISIHRLQNFIWTLIAIVIYFYRYGNPPKGDEQGLPVLDSTLLALTGISSLTYLTLKTRENPDPTPIPQTKILLTLSPASTLTATEQAALVTGGFPGAVVTITDPPGNTIKATADATNPNFGFIATNILSGSWTVIANWTGVPLAGGASRTLSATWTGQVTKATGSLPLNLA